MRIRMPAIVRENPADSFGLTLVGAAAVAVIVNALLLQSGGPRLVSAVPAPRPELAVQMPQDVENPAASASMLVREVQAELSGRGLYDGPVDGIFGPRTEAAIFDFEIGAGLKPTGKPNPALLSAMRGATGPTIIPSSRVAEVQRVLARQGFGPIKADGILGEGTRAAIRRFEGSRGLPQRGDVTPAFLRELTKVSGVQFD